jgi:hypothetical protein
MRRKTFKVFLFLSVYLVFIVQVLHASTPAITGTSGPEGFDWVDPLLRFLTPLAILVSATVAWIASQRSINHQKEVERNKDSLKKETVFKLLRDEIELRWPKIRETFSDLIGQKNKDGNWEKPLELNLQEGLKLAANCPMSTHDLFVFHQVAHNFSNFFVINNKDLISSIVYGHVLIMDLVDEKKRIAADIEKREQLQKSILESYPSDENRKTEVQNDTLKVMNCLRDGLQNTLDIIDEHFKLLLPKIQ